MMSLRACPTSSSLPQCPSSKPLCSDRQSTTGQDDARRTPDPGLAVARRLQAEEVLVPMRVVGEADVLDHERLLLPLPFDRPGEMCFLQMLPQLGEFDHIGRWEDKPKTHGIAGHHAISSTFRTTCRDYPARAARRNACGGWPKARMKARRIRSGSRKPVASATRSIASVDDCTRCRATSIRSRSTAFDGVAPVSAVNARAKCRALIPA